MKRRKVGNEIGTVSLSMLPNYMQMLTSELTRLQGLINLRVLSQNGGEQSDILILQSMVDVQLIPILIAYLTKPFPLDVQVVILLR